MEGYASVLERPEVLVVYIPLPSKGTHQMYMRILFKVAAGAAIRA